MRVYVVQENGPYGIEGEPQFFTSEIAAQRAMAIQLFVGSQMSDENPKFSMLEAWKFVNYRWGDGNMSYDEGEDNIFISILNEDRNPSIPSDEYDELIEAKTLGNRIFECSFFETSDLKNQVMVGVVRNESGKVKDYVYAGPDDFELFDRYVANNGQMLDMTSEK